jgi:hypothetical protein
MYRALPFHGSCAIMSALPSPLASPTRANVGTAQFTRLVVTQVKSPLPCENPTRYVTLPLVGAIAFAYALIINLNDPSGWSGLFTFPIYIANACLWIFDAIVFIRWAIKLPKEKRGRKIACWIAAVISLSPIIFVASHALINNYLHQAARDRATTPISLQEARQLVADCKVETIHRDEDATMELLEHTPTLGGRADHERRTFDLSYFDEIVALARANDVQDRCGFIPTYDLNRTKQPEIGKWITIDEAEAIIRKCTGSTDVHIDGNYKSMLELHGPNTTGILLLQRLEPWNDDVDSTIYSMSSDAALKASLKEKLAACHD